MGTHTVEQLADIGKVQPCSIGIYTVQRANGDIQYWVLGGNGKYYAWAYTTQNN